MLSCRTAAHSIINVTFQAQCETMASYNLQQHNNVLHLQCTDTVEWLGNFKIYQKSLLHNLI